MICSEYERLYNAVHDPQNGYINVDSIMLHTPQQIKTLLDCDCPVSSQQTRPQNSVAFFRTLLFFFSCCVDKKLRTRSSTLSSIRQSILSPILTLISITSSGVNWKMVINAVCMWFLRLIRPPRSHLALRSREHR